MCPQSPRPDGADNPLCRAALAYAARGWPVLPLHSVRDGRCTCGKAACLDVGKHPRTRHGVKDATTDQRIIARWWTWWPDANVGITTGAASGLDALDVDPFHGGDDSLAALERRHGSRPETVCSLTGGGGWHLLFRPSGIPIANKVGIAPGLDVRGEAGYIVAPPSLHKSGRHYTWAIGYGPDEVPLAPTPSWLLALMTATGGRLRRDGTPLVFVAGSRNDTLMRLGAALRRYGVGQAALVECLVAVNRHHAQPPLGEDEVRRIAASVAGYAPASSCLPRTVRVA